TADCGGGKGWTDHGRAVDHRVGGCLAGGDVAVLAAIRLRHVRAERNGESDGVGCGTSVPRHGVIAALCVNTDGILHALGAVDRISCGTRYILREHADRISGQAAPYIA